MKLLIIEPVATGHHMALYVRFLVRAAYRRGWSISLLTTPSAFAHPSFELVRSEVDEPIDVILMPEIKATSGSSVASLAWEQFQYYWQIKRTVASLSVDQIPDVVYVVNIDYFDKIASIFGSPFNEIPWVGMMMSLKYHRYQVGIGPKSRNDRLYKWLFLRLLHTKTLRYVTVIDEAFFDYAVKQGCPEYEKLRLVPDTGELVGSESVDTARSKLGIPSQSFNILVYGSLSSRKGIESLLTAVDSTGIPQSVIVTLAGVPDQDIRVLLKTPLAERLRSNGQLKEHLWFHDEAQEFRVFRAADVVWVGYVGGSYGSSGVLYQAGSLSLPVIATSHGLLGWLVKRHELGSTVDPRDIDAVVKVIVQLHQDRSCLLQAGLRGATYAVGHSASKFGESLCEILALFPSVE